MANFTLTPVTQKFVLHWGKRGPSWGVNRTVAQIHALLYISEEPLSAEQIAETLSVAPSEVGNSLRVLKSWRLVQVIHRPGDWRDHYETMEDVWEIFRTVLEERKRREIDTTLSLLRSCITDIEEGEEVDDYARQRLEESRDFLETGATVCDQIRKTPIPTMKRIARLGDKIAKIVSMAAGGRSSQRKNPRLL